jgi:GLPGLI family protein
MLNKLFTMKLFKLLFCLSFFFSLIIYSQEKEIAYKVEIKRQFSEKALEKFKRRSDKQKAKIEMNAYQNPKDEFYSLKILKNKSKLDYVEALLNDNKKSHIKVNNYPLGKQSFRIQDDSLIYYKFQFRKDDYYAKDTLVKGKWVKTQKDTVILNYTAQQLKLKTDDGIYKAWFTKELPEDLGIGALSYSDGFIIAYEFSYKATPILKSHVIKAFPYKEKKLKRRKEFEFTVPDKIYTRTEIEEIFRKRNEILNKPREVKN